MLRADVTAFSRHCAITEDGRPAGELDLSRWRERATLTTPDGTWVFRRRGTRHLTAEQPEDNRVATATSTHLNSRWQVESPAGAYALRRRFLRYGLTIERDVAPVGELTRQVLSQSCIVDLTDDVPVWLKAFLAWIAMIQRRRAVAAAAALGGS